MQETSLIFCDGLSWNGTLGICVRPIGHPKKVCVFDGGDLCGWSQHKSNSNQWEVIKNLEGPKNATAYTGSPYPSPFSSHYIHFEASDTPKDSIAALFSPVYELENARDACFMLHFAMNGRNMGSLQLLLMPENSEDFSTGYPLVLFEGDFGPHWIFWGVRLPAAKTMAPFQIVLVGKRGSSYLSDIDINYLELIVDEPEKCHKVIQASEAIGLIKDTDELSPESCLNRCSSNKTRTSWTEGYCTCLGDGISDCNDFQELCSQAKPPLFLVQLGLASWTHVGIAAITGLGVITVFAFVVAWVLRMRSSKSVMERTKRETVKW